MDEIQKENINTFRNYGIKNPEERIYKCAVCKKRTNINESYSNLGENLICVRCARKKFKSTNELYNWLKNSREGEADE